MRNNYRRVVKEVEKIVRQAAYSKKNQFTETVWKYHILPVVHHSLELGRKMKADLEVLELAALLHDYASLVRKDFYEDHHIHGARLAKGILTKLGVSLAKIEHVQECILSHRGSVKKKRETLEAKILASADAMSHVTEPADMFYLTYGIHRHRTREGARWLKGKIGRSWRKIMPAGKEMVKKDYELLLDILNRAI